MTIKYTHITDATKYWFYLWRKKNDTVNQLSFSTTMFHELPEINWFALTNFCDQALSPSPVFFITTIWQILIQIKNVHDNEALTKISHMRIKVCLQYSTCIYKSKHNHCMYINSCIFIYTIWVWYLMVDMPDLPVSG